MSRPWLFTLLGIGVLCASCSRRNFTEDVKMRDGVNLSTDVYLPKGDGPFPVVVYRTPYGRRAHYDDALVFRESGIAVVAQSLRGRSTSGGVDGMFTTDGDGELKDGYDTMAWIVKQDWSNGRIGTSGASALGIAQYMQASANPPGLVMMNPEFGTPNLYSDVLFQGGVYRNSLVHNWLEGQDNLKFEGEIEDHPFEDAFWESAQTADQYGEAHAAGFHVGGWFDIFQNGTIEGFRGYQYEGGDGAAGNQKLVMGPWTHVTRKRDVGELTFPKGADKPPYGDAFDVMLDHYLKVDIEGIRDSPDDIPNVQYYVMGDVDDKSAPGNEWRTDDDWPPEGAPVRLHLHSNGDLDEACPSSAAETTDYAHKPSDPTPTICGANLKIKAGPCDQRDIESREDVVVFDTGELSAPMEVTGRVTAHLFVRINRPDTDLMVRMTDVYPDGRSMLITDGALRLASRGTTTELESLEIGEVVEGVVDLLSTSIVINTGHRLRISVTSSNWPRFAVNKNNALEYPQSVESSGGPVTVRIHHDDEYASYLEVPDPTRTASSITTCGG